jgi:hypothetical protein
MSANYLDALQEINGNPEYPEDVRRRAGVAALHLMGQYPVETPAEDEPKEDWLKTFLSNPIVVGFIILALVAMAMELAQ